MPRVRFLLFPVVALALSLSTNAASLQLIAEHDGRRMPAVSVGGGTVYVSDGSKTVAAPPDATWKLEGDIRANAGLIRWSPSYSIYRTTSALEEPQAHWTGSVWLIHDPQPITIDRSTIKDAAVREQFDRQERHTSPFLDDWSDGDTIRGVLVFAWLLDGRVTKVVVQTEPSIAGELGFRCNPTFALTDDEARGQPVVAYWADGGFVAPVPLFAHAPTQEAMIDTLLDDRESLERSIRRARLKHYSRSRATLAHYAAEAGAANALQLLLKKQPKLATTPTENGTALPVSWAVANGRTHAVALLVDTLHESDSALPLLNRAIGLGHRAVVRQLLESTPVGETIDNPAREHPFMRAIDSAHVDVADEILNFATHGIPTVERARTLLQGSGHSAMVDYQLAKALVRHARSGRMRAVEWLIEKTGADPSVPSDGNTALSAAAERGHAGLINLLLAQGADVNQANAADDTPLMLAAARNRPEIVRRLLDAGADIHHANKQGFAALHFAALRNAAGVVAQLLDAGADLSFCNVSDMTALDTALLNGATDAIDQLVARGACIALGSQYSAALIEAAIRLDVAKTVEKAIQDGWPPNSTFAGIWPAIRVAQIFGSTKCEAVLRTAGAEAAVDKPMPVIAAEWLDAPLELRQETTPDDPRNLAEATESAAVELRCVVDRNGRVLFPTIVRSPDPQLGPAAATALLRQRFNPPLRNGQPIAVLTTRTVVFPSTAERIFNYSDVDTPPSKTRGLNPAYPRSAVRRELTARVEAEMVIDTSGRLESVQIIESPGPQFSEAVRVAVAMWEFRPGRHHDTPVRVRVRQVFHFAMP